MSPTVLNKTKILLSSEGVSYVLLPFKEFKSVTNFSDSELETLEILANPKLTREIFRRSRLANKGETVSLEQLKRELRS